MIYVRPMVETDVLEIAAVARHADIEEMRDGAGVTIEQALWQGLEHSLRASVIMAGDKPVAAFGDTSTGVLSGVGVPWLVSTIHVQKHARGFLRVCRPLVDDMLTRHFELMNYVDERNKAAIRWLEWLGFEMGETVTAAVSGLPFRKFTKSRG